MDSVFSVHIFFGLISLTDFQIDRSEYCTEIKDERICYSQGSAKTLNWTEAYQICTYNKATLPIIRNAKEKTNLDKYFEYLQGNRVNVNSAWLSGRWIGFDHWTWVNGRKLTGNIPFLEPRILPEEEETHAVLVYGLIYTTVSPYYSNFFLCQNDGQCKDGIGIQLTNSCLIQSDRWDSWYGARDHCIVEGGDLAVFNNQEDIDIFKNHNDRQPKYLSNWIGLRKGSWFWIQPPPNSREPENESGEVEKEEIKYYNWRNYANTFDTRRYRENRRNNPVFGTFSQSSNRSIDLWIILPCNVKQSVICQRRVYSNGSFSTASTGTNAFVLGLTLVGVLLFIAIAVIVWQVIRGKTNVSEMEPSPDGQYQGARNSHDINIDRELSDHYEEIGLETSGFQDLRTSQINTDTDIIDDYEDIDSQLEDAIE